MESNSESRKETPKSSAKQCLRYEILIPKYDTNGKAFPPHLYMITGAEIKSELGDYTIVPDVNLGTWTKKNGTIAIDETMTIYVDIPLKNKDIFDQKILKYKEKLKRRFKQEEIYITSYLIRIL